MKYRLSPLSDETSNDSGAERPQYPMFTVELSDDRVLPALQKTTIIIFYNIVSQLCVSFEKLSSKTTRSGTETRYH